MRLHDAASHTKRLSPFGEFSGERESLPELLSPSVANHRSELRIHHPLLGLGALSDVGVDDLMEDEGILIGIVRDDTLRGVVARLSERGIAKDRVGADKGAPHSGVPNHERHRGSGGEDLIAQKVSRHARILVGLVCPLKLERKNLLLTFGITACVSFEWDDRIPHEIRARKNVGLIALCAYGQYRDRRSIKALK